LRTLSLTSPVMRGEEVRNAQRRLNAFGVVAGVEDGVFGEQTARACSQAKWILGYANKDVKPIYGDELNAYLTGKKKPNLLMRQRASKRSNAQSLGAKALRAARTYVGVKEFPPNSNRVVFSEWYGIIGPWCMMFMSRIFVEAGSKAFKKGEHDSYCPFVVADAKAGRRGLMEVPRGHAETGDMVFFSWHHDGTANHVGIVVTPPNNNGTLITLEGNTSPTDNSNGGEVMIRTRDIADVLCFVRVTI
jgi:hypothetical protein